MSLWVVQVVNDAHSATKLQQLATDAEDALAKEQADVGADVQVFRLSNALDASREDVRRRVHCRPCSGLLRLW
jgi:hypothetical protein